MKEKNFKFTYEKKAQEMEAIYQKLTRPLKYFVETYFTHSDNPADWVSKSEFLGIFNSWAKRNNVSEYSNKDMSKEMEKLGYREGFARGYDGKTQRVWRFLTLSVYTLEKLKKEISADDYIEENTSYESKLPF